MGRVFLPRSMSVIAIQPRNSTVQCIFLAQFTSQELPFLMPRPIPNKQDRTVWPDSRYSLSTAHYPLLSALCFHGLTNCFSHKLFALINICVAPRVSPPRVHTIQEFRSRTNQLFYRHTVMNFLSSRKNHLHWDQQLPHSFTRTPGVGYAQNQRG